MKFHQFLSLGFLFAATAFLSVCPLRANLVINGDFTQEKDGFVADWQEKSGKMPLPIPLQGTIRSEKEEEISVEKMGGEKPISSLRIESKGEKGGECLLGPSYFPLVGGCEYEVSFRYRAEGLVPESVDRKTMVGVICDLFMEKEKGRIAAVRILTLNNTPEWVTLSKRFRVPAEATRGQIRFTLRNRLPGAKAKVWITDVTVEPLDPMLPNASFEQGSAPSSVQGWKSQGGGKSLWTTEVAHGGKASVSVSDAPDGPLSGWTTEIPVRPDRTYSLSGYVKGGVLNPNGFLGGGALAIQFLDAEGQPLGKPEISPAVGANTDWTEVATGTTQPPAGATTARLMAILQYCNGTAWFDDLNLTIKQAESKEVVRIKREHPIPSRSVTYAGNLLANGDVEQGTGEKPAGWTYVGKSTPDWTEAEIEEFHTKGRPNFAIGRGQGIWEHGITYSGKGALLNVSIAPPLSKNLQWYGCNPVDGYWLSDPMPCEAHGKYIAGAWIRPGKEISVGEGASWFGPLEIRFYNEKGNQVKQQVEPRSPMGSMPPGLWNYCATQPYQAPEGATTMRLRFGQELSAQTGGWGRMYGDDFAVWKLGDEISLTDYQTTTHTPLAFWSWFQKATEKVKPPYQPSPTEAAEYDSVLGRVINRTSGNLYEDPKKKVKLTFSLASLLGEDRSGLSMKIIRYDARGRESEPLILSGITLPAYGTTLVNATLPSSGSYGSYYVDARIYEGTAQVGSASGRYAVLPRLQRPHTSENLFGVTLLDSNEEKIDYTPERKKEVGELLRIAGFGIGWVNFSFDVHHEAETLKNLEDLKEKIAWFQSLGIRTVVRLRPNQGHQGVERPLDVKAYQAAGALLGRELKHQAAAFGNWGVEQANSGSPYRGGGKERVTDTEYDTILAALYDGIKSADPDAVVLTGNIATDGEAKTLHRLYGAPVNGRFDGAILNAYMGQLTVCQNSLKEFDAHGDKAKTIWQEEMAEQRSPFEGEARRYGEIQGAEQMVRVWLTLVGKLNPRIKSVTMWGFCNRVNEDIMMVTPDLQPRPQFVAHAVMSDALADATFVADRSQGGLSLFEWKRPAGGSAATPGKNDTLLAAWSNAGNRSLTLEVPSGTLQVMDIFGNVREIAPTNGLVTLELTPSPVYLSGASGITLSKRLETSLAHADTVLGEKAVKLSLKNNDTRQIEGEIAWSAGDAGQKKALASVPFRLQAGEETSFTQKIEGELPQGSKTPVRATLKTKEGSVFEAISSLNFAQAVRTQKPPSLDGTWNDWKSSMVIPFGAIPSEINKGSSPDDYSGKKDLLGTLRFLWDEKYFYLGVEALDDKFVPQPLRGRQGFMGDSIEFGVQPDGIGTSDAPYWEYELYLPGDGKNVYAASRRKPFPEADITAWHASVTPTGTRGNVNYQVAIPWKDLGVKEAKAGKSFALSVVLNDADSPEQIGGGRKRIFWFTGVDGKKDPTGFGDVTLVNPSALPPPQS